MDDNIEGHAKGTLSSSTQWMDSSLRAVKTDDNAKSRAGQD